MPRKLHVETPELDPLAREIAREVRQDRETIKVLVEAIDALIAMIDDSMDGREFEGGVYELGVTDVELRPGGSYMLSHARAALSLATGKEG